MKLPIFLLALMLLSGCVTASETVKCFPMTEAKSKALAFGYPNEFYECSDGAWFLGRPINYEFVRNYKK